MDVGKLYCMTTAQGKYSCPYHQSWTVSRKITIKVPKAFLAVTCNTYKAPDGSLEAENTK
jgi:hypothetical protein